MHFLVYMNISCIPVKTHKKRHNVSQPTRMRHDPDSFTAGSVIFTHILQNAAKTPPKRLSILQNAQNRTSASKSELTPQTANYCKIHICHRICSKKRKRKEKEQE